MHRESPGAPPDSLRYSHFTLPFRERDAMALVARGLLDDPIADCLGLDVVAVRCIRRHFRDRPGIAGRYAVAWRIEHGQCCL